MASKKKLRKRVRQSESALAALASALTREHESRLARATEENERLWTLLSATDQRPQAIADPSTTSSERLRAEIARLTDENQRLWREVSRLASEAAERIDAREFRES